MKLYDIGVYGLGVMGASLAKNMIGKEIHTSLYAPTEKEKNTFCCDGEYEIFSTEEAFVKSLAKPRKIFMMVTAGAAVDEVIERLLPLLEEGDILMDGGNSHFADTKRRTLMLGQKNIGFLGVGVSGGEKGALLGPSIMVGGHESAWKHCGPMLKKIAAKFEDVACCEYLGKEGSGHYVKMVHNGIEYAIMQVIADFYSIMKDGLGYTEEKISNIFGAWKETEVSCYLLDITTEILKKQDDDGTLLLEHILDVAKQKGTGSWTLEEGIARGVYMPTICEAVFARYFSVEKQFRQKASTILKVAPQKSDLENPEEALKNAFYLAMLTCYAQGITLIQKASEDFGWEIDVVLAVSLWREGCIIRSKMLVDIMGAMKASSDNLLLTLADKCSEADLRNVCVLAIKQGIAIPTCMSTLSYYDYCKTERMNVNLVQAMRDCFGAHTYERLDKKGTFHTQWIEEE